MEGIEVAYFLVHSMGGPAAFDAEDRRAAACFRDAAAAAGVRRIVYLGGLGRDDDPRLSRHLRSRHEVGRVLADGPVPVTELRAAVIIGSGSASFEMLRYLVEVLPVMVTPRWVRNRCQPIAIRDVLGWLVGAAAHAGPSEVLEIGGPDVLSYREMMQAYAEAAGLARRVIIPVPVLSPKLSSLWVGLVTPLPAGLARPLVESLTNEVIVTEPPAHDDLGREPAHPSAPRSTRRCAGRPISTSPPGGPTRRCRVAHPPTRSRPIPSGRAGACSSTSATRSRRPPPAALFATVDRDRGRARAGTSTPFLWRRAGGPTSSSAGSACAAVAVTPIVLWVGDALDFWRVEAVEAGLAPAAPRRDATPGRGLDRVAHRPGPRRGACSRNERASSRAGWPGAPTGTRLIPFHGIIFARLATRLAAAAEGSLPLRSPARHRRSRSARRRRPRRRGRGGTGTARSHPAPTA